MYFKQNSQIQSFGHLPYSSKVFIYKSVNIVLGFQTYQISYLTWIRGEIPGFNFKSSNLHSVNVFHLDDNSLSDQHQTRVLFLQVFLRFLVLFRQSLFTHLGQRLVFFLERGGGGVHLGVGLLHVVDLVVFPLLVPRDLPVSLRQVVPILTLAVSMF